METWAKARKEFIEVKPKTDADRAAQLIMNNIKDRDMLRQTYRSAPDLFDGMSHPRLNMLMFNML